jgi:putative transposase
MILQSVRWYLAHSLSYPDIEEIMKERGFKVDHSIIQRWVVHYSPIHHPNWRRHFTRKRKGLVTDGDFMRLMSK